MTALDDALNTSTPIFAQPTLLADWVEQPENYVNNPDPEPLRNLSGQIGPAGVVIEHSIEDGLPDPVTMTSSNAASATLTAELVGRQARHADTIAWRTGTTTGGGTGTAIVPTFPSDVTWGDYCLIALTVNSVSVAITDPRVIANDLQAWKMLVSTEDPGGIKTYIYGKHYSVGMTTPQLTAGSSVSYSWVSVAISARTANGMQVPFRIAQVAGLEETVSGTNHTTPAVSLTRRGYIVGIFSTGSGAGPWTGTNELGESVVGTMDVMVSTSARVQPGSYTASATTTLATAVATLTAIALEVWDAPIMDARRFYSPFNTDSPLYGWDRDNAAMQAAINVQGDAGEISTSIYKGQMADIRLNGRSAQLMGISKTRLDMDVSVPLPVVWAYRENCTVDWFATYLMARGGQFGGPAPGPRARYWAPAYGSTHAHLAGDLTYNCGFRYSDPAGTTGWKPPTVTDGPFNSAMYAEQQNAQTLEVCHTFIPSSERLPNWGTDTTVYDQISQANNIGRFHCWIKGNAVASSPTGHSPAVNTIMVYVLQALDVASNIRGGLEIGIRSDTRKLYAKMGDYNIGYITVDSTVVLPTDNLWHFVGFAWNFVGNLVKVKMDATEQVLSGFATSPSPLPTTDARQYEVGGRIFNRLRFHLPHSDIEVEAGPDRYSAAWTRYYPNPTGQTATMRPTFQAIEVISDSVPVQGWDTIAELAQASLSYYRCNETDGFEFLPPKYFGETAQLTPVMIADTEVNASELNVVNDPTKTRNVVTVQFTQTLADSVITPALKFSTATEIPKGTTTMVFLLEEPIAELHKASDLGQSVPILLTNLTEAQVDAATIPAGVHYMTINDTQDGSGLYLNNVNTKGRIIAWDASSVTITFTHNNPKSVWLVNDGSSVPFLNIMGYVVKYIDGYVTKRDGGSIGTRRERALTSEIPWIHNRAVATAIAQQLVGMLSRPRAEVSVTVMGDPRIKPGNMVTLADSDGTQAKGPWRVLAVTHNAVGAQYTLDLDLVAVLPAAVWDGVDGWDYAVWSQ